MNQQGMLERIERLEKMLERLEAKNRRLEDIREIENLFGRYQFMQTAGLHEEVLELFALKTPGCRVELGPSGVYEGPEGVRNFIYEIHT